MAYSFTNICSKNYWNRTLIVKIIVGGWVVSIFETQCIYTVSCLTNDTDVAHYNFNAHQPISLIWGTNITE